MTILKRIQHKVSSLKYHRLTKLKVCVSYLRQTTSYLSKSHLILERFWTKISIIEKSVLIKIGGMKILYSSIISSIANYYLQTDVISIQQLTWLTAGAIRLLRFPKSPNESADISQRQHCERDPKIGQKRSNQNSARQ